MLRSTSELTGSAVEAVDGRLVVVSDLLFDDRTWKIAAIVVDDAGEVEFVPPLSGPLPSPEAVGTYLHSSSELPFFLISASDSVVGTVSDCIVDTLRWTISYVIVATSGLRSSKSVLIPARAVESIDWPKRAIQAGVRSAAVLSAPAYRGHGAITPDFEAVLHSHYGLSRRSH